MERKGMLPGRKYAPLQLGRVLVLGLGKSGQAVCRYCFPLLGTRVASLTVVAGKSNEEARAFAAQLTHKNVTIVFEQDTFEETYDLCVASPGISQFSELYQQALRASKELIGEVEFAWRESKDTSSWIAVTGTNGKTTTTALIAHILQTAGYKALAVGNIGESCLEAVEKQNVDRYVAEVSSYQLASTRFFAPHIALLLNITPDHLAWHQSHAAYVAAKLKLFENLSSESGAVAILDATDDEVRTFVKKIKHHTDSERGFSYIPLGAAAGLSADMREACGSDNAAFIEEGMFHVCFQGHEYIPGAVAELCIQGEHNQANALAAAAAALIAGVDEKTIRQALSSFLPLEHRIEPCGSVKGIRCFNDSKATNSDATLKALSAFGDEKPIVLLGGSDKGTSLELLVKEAEKQAKAVVCFGEAGTRFFEAFSEASIPSYRATVLEDAFDCALTIAEKDDLILLSPACASFDEFTSFEERGRVFKDLVNRRSQEQGV